MRPEVFGASMLSFETISAARSETTPDANVTKV
jgi:hypothetical protein